MRARQSGFTMIELVMVIVILGILAAIAMPRFVDLSSDAKASALSGVAGSAASAMAINFAACTTVNHVASLSAPYRCRKVDTCDDVTSLLQGGALPSGYTVNTTAIGTGLAGSNGVEVNTCAITQTATSDTANFGGISAGNGP